MDDNLTEPTAENSGGAQNTVTPASLDTPVVATPNLNIPATPAAVESPSKNKVPKKVLASVVAGAVLLLGGGGIAAFQMTQNTPEKIWNRSLKTSAAGFESILGRPAETLPTGGTMVGSFKLTEPIAADGSMEAEWSETDMEFSMNAGFAGTRFGAEIVAVDAPQSDSPDMYMKVTGVDGIGTLLGIPEGSDSPLSQINDTWYSIDHTLLDEALASAEGENDAALPSQEELDKISETIRSIVVDRILTDDTSKAVFTVAQDLGKEDFEGRDTYKYELQIQKEQLKQFVTEMRDGLKETGLADLLMSGSSLNQDVEDVFDVDSLLEDIEKADLTDGTIHAWVDAETKILRNIRLQPKSQEEGRTNYVDISILYDGESEEVPFRLKVVEQTEGNNDESSIAFTITMNRSTQAVGVDMTANMPASEFASAVDASFTMDIFPGYDDFKATIPEGSKNFLELFNSLNSQATGVNEFGSDLMFDESFYDDSLYNDDASLEEEL